MSTKADDPRLSTTNGVVPGHEDSGVAPGPVRADGQHESYWVLSQEERTKGWVRPLRRSYSHNACGGVTTMGLALCETYAKEPGFYTATFCARCGNHFPVSDFKWLEDGTVVGS